MFAKMNAMNNVERGPCASLASRNGDEPKKVFALSSVPMIALLSLPCILSIPLVSTIELNSLQLGGRIIL
jgi:hypothetical protein